MRSVRYGLGAYDPTVLDVLGPTRELRIGAELCRLERERMTLCLDVLEPVACGERVLGTGLPPDSTAALRQRFGCAVDEGDQGWTGFPDGRFDAIVDEWMPRATDLFERCGGLARLLRPRGRCVFTTWCVNDGVPNDDGDIRRLDRDLGLSTQPRARLFAALTSNGLVPYVIADLTAQAVPYWQLRLHAATRTGVERAFLSAYLNHAASLLLVAAERFDTPHRTTSRTSHRAQRRTEKRRTMATRSPGAAPNLAPVDASGFGLRYD